MFDCNIDVRVFESFHFVIADSAVKSQGKYVLQTKPRRDDTDNSIITEFRQLIFGVTARPKQATGTVDR
jgi:hypothetical protein